MAHKDAQEPPATERSLRNPRRRNRVESESIKIAPRRKRSKITENTFLPRDSPDETIDEEVKPNGNRIHSISRSNARQTSGSFASGDSEMPVRLARGGTKRTSRADGARVLTQNEEYVVKLLPSTPKELQHKGVEFRGNISSSTNSALAVTREKAYIWDYNGHTGASGTKSVDVPFSCGKDETIPHGALVTSGSELGLLLVSATTGKIIYHESIDRVTALGFFQERKDGVEGHIAGLFTGEKVLDLCSAEPAGFVALLTSGRIVHISLRDTQGKAQIHTQFLHAVEQATGGLFGSIKSILGAGAWKQGVNAIRTRKLDRGQVQVLGLLEKGELRLFDLDWSGNYEHRASIDFREQLQHELRQMRPAERQGEVDYMALLDIAILERSGQHELVPTGAPKALDTILLVRCGAKGMYSYCLVEFSLMDQDFTIARVLDVVVDSQSVSTQQPQLIVPTPGHTAFVVLTDALAIVSLAIAALDPEAQLHEASYIEPRSYQDAIYLRGEETAFSNACADTSRLTADASIVAFVHGSGLVRVTTHDIHLDSTDSEALTKSRIEQAVLYGYLDNNILDLTRPDDKRPSLEDVEQAALMISNEILSSSPRLFDTPPTSVSTNLQKRAEAASNLATYMQKRYPRLSNKVKWQLLVNAEKIAAGMKLWSSFENNINTTTKEKRKAALLNEVCETIRLKYPFDSLWSQSSADDVVRTFFVTQLDKIDKLLPWTRRVLEDVRNDGMRTPEEILRLVLEADDIWLCCLNTAFDFRQQNATKFGIHLKLLNDITPDPTDLQDVAELWTSFEVILKEIVRIVDISREAAEDLYENDPSVPVEKVAKGNPALVDLLCQTYLERIAWCRSRGSAKYDAQAQRLAADIDSLQNSRIRSLANLGGSNEAMWLAEKYRDMRTLTEVLIAESQYLTDSMESVAHSELAGIQTSLDAINKKTTKYFERFGDEFAEAFFGEGFAGGRGGKMLTNGNAQWQEPMTQWLRRDPGRAKVCWINDIIHDQDFKHASRCLYQVATEREDNVWNKKVELSLAKLAVNALSEDDDSIGATVRDTNATIELDLAIVDVQDRLYLHVVPETYHSVDDEAGVQLAMQTFGCTLLAFKTWHRLISQSMAKLLSHRTLNAEELLDLITLCESGTNSYDDQDRERSETFEAMIALNSAQHFESGMHNTLTKLIWKRAYLREDWEAINQHASNESEADMQQILLTTNIFRAITAVMNAKKSMPGLDMAILEPVATLGAGCHVDDVSTYIPQELRSEVLEENIIMERQMEALIREQRVESWYNDIFKLAKKAVAGEEITDVWTLDHSETNGHAANGTLTSIKTEDEDEASRLAEIEQAPDHHNTNDIEVEFS